MSSSGFVASGKAQIYYETSGNGHPVVFLHAGVANSRMWDAQFERVLEGFEFVRIDLRGFGHTKIPMEPYTDCEDVLAVMDHLDIDRAVMVGCSMGAEVGLNMAALAPYRLEGLVLIGAAAPGFHAPSADYHSPQWPEAVEAFTAGDMARTAELEAEMWLVGRDRERSDVDPDLFEMVVAMDFAALMTEAKRDHNRKAPGLERLPHIEVPVLVVVGDHDLPQLIEAAEHFEETIEKARRVVIDDAAHLPSLEQPEAFNDALSAFLRS